MQIEDMLVQQLKEQIKDLEAALQQYANKDSWGETAAWGTTKRNRWLNDPCGWTVAEDALKKLKS